MVLSCRRPLALTLGRFDTYDGTGSYTRLNWEEKFTRGGVDAIIFSGSSLPHATNPPGELPLVALQRSLDTIISEGTHTFRAYLLLRFWPSR